MKQIVTILFATCLLLACNTGNEKESATAAVAENHTEHAEQANRLALNKGAKWKADATTIFNAAQLKKIITTSKRESLADYSQTTADLQNALNKMVSECKMKGADHDALHHWLEPLMKKTKELKNANSVEAAGKIFTEIEEQINLFSQYFE